jgi:DNA-directed RNA polymerase subunit RPC12/RpoP
VDEEEIEKRKRLLSGYMRFGGDLPSKVANQVFAQWSEEQVWCPHCGERYQVEAGDGDDDLVTYHGEEGPIEKTCEACGKLFFVKEHVYRTYTSGMTTEEAEE